MVLNAVVQDFQVVEQLKAKIAKETDHTSPDKTLLLVRLQKIYQKILLTDLDYALERKIERDLWNFAFKNKIEILQSAARDKKNVRRNDSQTLLTSVLQSATGFYICFLHRICNTFDLDLPFRFRFPKAISLSSTNRIEFKPPQPSSCWYICQDCLVHLGDLARYSKQLQLADTFYRDALSVSPRNGQPYNQLGLLRAARGDKLSAAYFHARSLAVIGPFPPAANNLAYTLASSLVIANSFTKKESRHSKNISNVEHSKQSKPLTLNSQSYINNYIVLHYKLQNGVDVDTLREDLSNLCSSLVALVATDELDTETLLKMCCLDLYAIYSITEGHKLNENELSEDEKNVHFLIMELISGSLAALLLPAHTRNVNETISYGALPSIKVILEWLRLHPDSLLHSSFTSRPQIWMGLCTLLNNLTEALDKFSEEFYETTPLPEDIELQGFLPVDSAFCNLTFQHPTYGGTNKIDKSPENNDEKQSRKEMNSEMAELMQEQMILKKKALIISENKEKYEGQISNLLRACRILKLGEWISNYQKERGLDYFNLVNDSTKLSKVFKSTQNSSEINADMLKTINEISLLREKRLLESLQKESEDIDENVDDDNDVSDSETKEDQNEKSVLNEVSIVDEEIVLPIVITPADFKEKIKEKRAGILKPQGSLEKAREEKSLSRSCVTVSPEIVKITDEIVTDTPNTQETGSSSSTVSQDGNICAEINLLLDSSMLDGDKSLMIKDNKKIRTNVAMETIMKKQDENSKQVKFLSPVTTPEPNESSVFNQAENKSVVQPKVMKSLGSSIDRKAGGILSLKDKTAGYPHLVKVDTPISTDQSKSTDANNDGHAQVSKPAKSPKDTEDRRIPEFFSGGPLPRHGGVPQEPPYTPWSDGKYNIQSQLPDWNAELKNSNADNNVYNYSYFPSNSLSFPVINPKEIDIRSAAMQKPRNAQGIPNTGFGGGYFQTDGFKDDSHWSPVRTVTKPHIPRDSNNQPRMANLPPRFSNLKKAEGVNEQSHAEPQNAFNVLPYKENPSSLWWNPPPPSNYAYPGYVPHIAPDDASVPNRNFHSNTLNFDNNTGYNKVQFPYFDQQSRANSGFGQVPNYPSLAMNAGIFESLGNNQAGGDASMKLDASIPEFVPRNVPAETSTSNTPYGDSNLYSLFSAPKSPWQQNTPTNEPYNQQKMWTGTAQSPLEKLLQQQNQFKYPKNDK